MNNKNLQNLEDLKRKITRQNGTNKQMRANRKWKSLPDLIKTPTQILMIIVSTVNLIRKLYKRSENVPIWKERALNSEKTEFYVY